RLPAEARRDRPRLRRLAAGLAAGRALPAARGRRDVGALGGAVVPGAVPALQGRCVRLAAVRGLRGALPLLLARLGVPVARVRALGDGARARSADGGGRADGAVPAPPRGQARRRGVPLDPRRARTRRAGLAVPLVLDRRADPR